MAMQTTARCHRFRGGDYPNRRGGENKTHGVALGGAVSPGVWPATNYPAPEDPSRQSGPGNSPGHTATMGGTCRVQTPGMRGPYRGGRRGEEYLNLIALGE